MNAIKKDIPYLQAEYPLIRRRTGMSAPEAAVAFDRPRHHSHGRSWFARGLGLNLTDR